MKHLLPLFLLLFLVSSCKDKCDDAVCPAGYSCVDGVCAETNPGSNCDNSYCPTGFTCVNGVCSETNPSCPFGYEGTNCDTAYNEKFAGDYDVDYTGTGGLSSSSGNTTAFVTLVSGTANKIRIDVDLDLSATVLGQAVALPLSISIEGETTSDSYNIPNTSIQTSIDLGGIPFDVDLNFAITGDKISANQLNSTLTMTGLLNGTIVMTGTK